MFHKVMMLLDKFFCLYLGLQHEQVKVNSIKVVKESLIIGLSTSNKRHIHSDTWEHFSHTDFDATDQVNKEKLGIAMGKAIAKNLVISFEKINYPDKH